jgi:hypothetical protein
LERYRYGSFLAWDYSHKRNDWLSSNFFEGELVYGITSVMAALMPWEHLWTVLFFGLDKDLMALVSRCLRGKMRGEERCKRVRREAIESYF